MTKLIPEKLVLSDEELEKIQSFAACNFSPELIAKGLDVDTDVFLSFWRNKDSDVRQAFSFPASNA